MNVDTVNPWNPGTLQPFFNEDRRGAMKINYLLLGQRGTITIGCNWCMGGAGIWLAAAFNLVTAGRRNFRSLTRAGGIRLCVVRIVYVHVPCYI